MIESQALYSSDFQLSEVLINTAEIYDDGFLRVEHRNYFVACGQKLVKLARAEFLIFSILSKNANRFIESREIWHYVWQDERAFNPESLKVNIYNLRRHFAPFEITITTMAKVGYMLVPRIKSQEK